MLDVDSDGVVSLSDFMTCCMDDEIIKKFDTEGKNFKVEE